MSIKSNLYVALAATGIGLGGLATPSSAAGKRPIVEPTPEKKAAHEEDFRLVFGLITGTVVAPIGLSLLWYRQEKLRQKTGGRIGEYIDHDFKNGTIKYYFMPLPKDWIEKWGHLDSDYYFETLCYRNKRESEEEKRNESKTKSTSEKLERKDGII